jgi:hypothetical protein
MPNIAVPIFGAIMILVSILLNNDRAAISPEANKLHDNTIHVEYGRNAAILGKIKGLTPSRFMVVMRQPFCQKGSSSFILIDRPYQHPYRLSQQMGIQELHTDRGIERARQIYVVLLRSYIQSFPIDSQGL